MYAGKTFLAVIPARAGSKGVPGKNTADLGGKPLIAWTVETAARSGYLDRVLCSTDDEGIAAAARDAGCEVPFLRPAELARDETLIEDVIFHLLDFLKAKFDYLVLLQPTSPLREAGDIDHCIETCLDAGAPACVTVTESAKPPYWSYRMDGDGKALVPLFPDLSSAGRRQDLPRAWAVNGAVYVARTDWYLKTKTFFTAETIGLSMPAERSVDVDTPFDLRVIRALVAQSAMTTTHANDPSR
jgi:N-acylneuraminate cytidylyltransferase